MSNIMIKIRQSMNGEFALDNKYKYGAIVTAIALIHGLFAVVFGCQGFNFLYVYNAIVTFIYLWQGIILVRRGCYTTIFFSCVVEIMFHAVVASILLGWDWGFMTYTIALIPVSFYLAYTLPQFKYRISVPASVSLGVISCYILVRAHCGRVEPVYDPEQFSDALVVSFYYVNTMVTFVMMLIFSILFAMEIRYMQRKLEQENDKLAEIANYDPLTKLLNRRSMNMHISKALEQVADQKSTFCLVLVDIDDFKKVNDTYGHDCGDEVLIFVSEIVRDFVGNAGKVCRWGGEEILLLLHSDMNQAKDMAERVCRNIANNEICYQDQKIQVTVTLGIARYDEGLSIKDMLKKADERLYWGKNHGKNQVVCESQELGEVQ